MKVDSRKKASRPLDRQWSPEDVSDEPGVVAPVHPELELLDDARDDSQGEVDQEQLAEELGQPQPRLVARAYPGRLEAATIADRPMVIGTKRKW
jgi:hypothetical protein